MTSSNFNIKAQRSGHLAWESSQSEKQIAVLMSGGVDSSTVAYLLKQQARNVLGITMKIPLSSTAGKRTCCGSDAAFVCDHLTIPHYFVDVTEPFEDLIIEPFRRSYSSGRTPNPCIDCNSFLKFSLLWDFLKEKFGTTYLATGHYARIHDADGRFLLGKAEDIAKDQSYFLYGIATERLPNLVLPLGEFTKEQVRKIAADANLPVAEKSESMELCFAGEGDYRAVLTDTSLNQSGDVTDMQGNKISEHKGVANFTLGQRSGVGFAGGVPLYVAKIDAQNNTIALGTRDQVSFRTVTANRVNILVPDELVVGSRFLGKIRSYVESHNCKLTELTQESMTVEFDQPQFAPCPGQHLVLYNSKDYIIAGGTIMENADCND